MKKSIFTVSAIIGLLTIATSFSSTDVMKTQSKERSEVSDKEKKSRRIRFVMAFWHRTELRFFLVIMMWGALLLKVQAPEISMKLITEVVFKRFRNIMTGFLRVPIPFQPCRAREVG